MNRRIRAILGRLATIGTMALMASRASAAIVSLDFTVQDFVPGGFTTTAAPVDPVSGHLVWRAASLPGAIDQLLSLDLTIDGHTYALAEVGYESFTDNTGFIVGGLLNGIHGWNPATDDFFYTFGPTNPGVFEYASSRHPGFWVGTHFTEYRLNVQAEVAEPAPAALVLTGLLILAALPGGRGSRSSLAVP